MTLIKKEITASVNPVDSDSVNGEFDVILSTDALDRDGDRLFADEWKQPLPDRIHFDTDHAMSVEATVGSGRPFINEEGQMQVRGTFAGTPHGQTVRQLVNEGHVRSVSVAFMQSKTKKDAKPVRELLNAAFCAIPSNPEAVILSSKAVDAETVADAAEPDDMAEDVPTHDDLVQAVHDAATYLGATCAAAKSFNTVKASSILAGSLPAPDTAPAATVTEESLTVPAAAPSADEVALRSRAFLMIKTVGKGYDNV